MTTFSPVEVQEAINNAVAAERDACAKLAAAIAKKPRVVYDDDGPDWQSGWYGAATKIANDIRARSGRAEADSPGA